MISTAKTFNICSSIARWILRQTRHLAMPCLRACRSPSTSVTGLSISSATALWSRDTGWSPQASSGDVRVLNRGGQASLSVEGSPDEGHLPVQADQTQESFLKAGRFPQGHAKQHLHRQARRPRPTESLMTTHRASAANGGFPHGCQLIGDFVVHRSTPSDKVSASSRSAPPSFGASNGCHRHWVPGLSNSPIPAGSARTVVSTDAGCGADDWPINT